VFSLELGNFFCVLVSMLFNIAINGELMRAIKSFWNFDINRYQVGEMVKVVDSNTYIIESVDAEHRSITIVGPYNSRKTVGMTEVVFAEYAEASDGGWFRAYRRGDYLSLWELLKTYGNLLKTKIMKTFIKHSY